MPASTLGIMSYLPRIEFPEGTPIDEAVDFVITHELCHLVHFSHDKHFYALMDRAMPKWRDREGLLSVKTQPYQHLLF